MLYVWMYSLPAVYCGLIFWLSDQPSVSTGNVNDKLVHILAYGLLGALVTRAVYFTTTWGLGRVFGASALFCILYGLSDEWHQSFVPGRDASIGDWLADGVGALLGTVVTLLLYVGISYLAKKYKLPTSRFTRFIENDNRNS